MMDPAHRLRFFLGRSMQRTIFRWFLLTNLINGFVVFLLMRAMQTAVCADGSIPHGPRWRIFALGGFIVIVWAMSGALARRLARPIVELARAADALGKGELDARVDVSHAGRGEAHVVARIFNTMAERIQRQINDQQTLLAAVSHELRTPLSRMTFLTERIRAGDAAALASIDEEIRGIDALVGDLLATSRMDFEKRARTLVEAADLALRAIEETEEDPAKIVVRDKPRFSADATLVVRALVNVIENAKRHAGGVNELRVDEVGDQVVFTIDDAGPGFERGEETRVFDAFYKNPRTDEARAKSVGLGLALVRRIAEWHGGKARAENRSGGGARLVLEFPRKPKEGDRV
jgi:signal transduction histidine kinase